MMKLLKIKQLSLALIIILSAYNANAVNVVAKSSSSKNAIILKKAEMAFQDMKFSIAADNYETYLENTNTPNPALLVNLAECYWQMRELDEALRVYKQLYPNGEKGVDTKIQKRIAELYARNGEYTKAASWLRDVPGFESKADAYNLKSTLNAFKRDSLNWKLYFLNINTSYREFAPLIDHTTLYFSSNKVPVGTTKSYGWDGDNFTRLWQVPISKLDSMNRLNGNTTKLKTATKKVIRLADIYENGDNKSKKDQTRLLIRDPYLTNDSAQYGTLVNGLKKETFNAGTIAIDKNDHIYLSANYPKGDKSGVNRIRLMEGRISNNTVSDLKALPFGDANVYSVMHPAVNEEGTILVFSSDKPNGVGGYDLYYSQRTDSLQKWTSPTAFSQNINTEGNEVFPGITPKGMLYFSSDQLPGLGGLDIYRIPLNDAIAGKGKPEHLSYPVNSGADDFGMTLDSTEANGYFASDRLNSNDNLYGFHFEVRLVGLTFVVGTVADKQTMAPLEGATVFILNKLTDTVLVAKTDENGQFRVCISTSGDYVIKAIEKDYSNDCLSMSALVKPVYNDTIEQTPRHLLLDNFKIGLKIRLDNIHYDFDKWFIRADARPILDSLVTVLNRYPIKVELSSHTDCRGSYAYNDQLSQKRAESAVAYLVKHGIDAKRITAKGYGERQLLNKCADGVPCSRADHQANRRTEVKVTGFTVKAPELEIDPDKYANGQVITVKELPTGFFDKCK